jgi:hypothetical protein
MDWLNIYMALFFSYYVACQLATYGILFLRLDVPFSLVNKGAYEKYPFSLTVATHVSTCNKKKCKPT